MFRSTLYSLLLLPVFLLCTTNASIRWDAISTVQYPKYYVVHSGAKAGDDVRLVKKTADDTTPAGSNLVVYTNQTISNPNGDLFIGTDSEFTKLIWVSEPLSWITLSLTKGFSLLTWKTSELTACWYHNDDATIVALKYCPIGGQQDEIKYDWAWD